MNEISEDDYFQQDLNDSVEIDSVTSDQKEKELVSTFTLKFNLKTLIK